MIFFGFYNPRGASRRFGAEMAAARPVDQPGATLTSSMPRPRYNLSASILSASIHAFNFANRRCGRGGPPGRGALEEAQRLVEVPRHALAV
mmetsp:Transcript_18869/g.64906  ORF Transcript_18869/g.64906 Transcript_18869/m.64906 type:complete len:91 (+) Transcript_18869:131-403(+)